MNYHFTTTKAHIVLNSGSLKMVIKKDTDVTSTYPFRKYGYTKIKDVIQCKGKENIVLLMEAFQIGGQPATRLKKFEKCVTK